MLVFNLFLHKFIANNAGSAGWLPVLFPATLFAEKANKPWHAREKAHSDIDPTSGECPIAFTLAVH